MMICRNISVPDGLTNGTRVQIKKILPRFYDCHIYQIKIIFFKVNLLSSVGY